MAAMEKHLSPARTLISRRWLALVAGVLLGVALSATDLAPLDRDAALERAAALRTNGDWTEAQGNLQSLWEAQGSLPDLTVALAYGHMCLLNGAAAQAEAPLRAAAESESPLVPYARPLLAECLHTQGKDAEAVLILRQILANRPSPHAESSALNLLARCQRSERRWSDEAATLRRLLALQPRGAQAEAARFHLAQALDGAGQHLAAFQAYQEIYWKRSTSPFARQAGLQASRMAREYGYALRRLSSLQTIEAAQRWFKAGRSADALDLLDAIPARALKGDLAIRERLLRVQILYALRENGKAVAEADGLLRDAGPTKPSLLALLKAAWALLRTGDHAGIVARGNQILQGAGDAEAIRVEALHCMGTSAYVHGRFAEADKTLAKMEGLKGDPATLASGRYKRAWCLFMAGDVAGARTLFDGLARLSSGPELHDPSVYWSGRCDLLLGDTAAGRARMRTLAEARPPGYWGWRAREFLAKVGATVPPEALPPVPGDWRAALADPRASLARELDWCGLEADAAGAFEPIYAARRAQPLVAYAMATLLTRAGDPGGGLAVLRKAFGPAADQYDSGPAWLAVAYPAPYAGRIKTLSNREGLDPALVYAVVRQESDFDEAAVSPAGARGLMQLMPATAAKVAAEMGLPAPSGSGLLNPITNLDLGIHYLGTLRRAFDPAGTAASYNAGEDIVGGWVTAWGPVNEEQFIAMIPYAETRHYAAQVLWYRHRYQQVLGSG